MRFQVKPCSQTVGRSRSGTSANRILFWSLLAMPGLLLPAVSVCGSPLPDHVDVALGDVSINKLAFLVAEDRHIYRRYGLDVHQFVTPSAARVVAANGIEVPPANIGHDGEDAPLMIGGGAWLIAKVAEGRAGESHRVIIATTENIVRDHIIARPGINSEQDLRGKTLGAGLRNVPGYAAIVYLRRMGLDGQVKVTGEASLDALKAGRVDAIVANLFAVAKAPALGFIDLVDISRYGLPEAGSGILADPEWLSRHRDIAIRFTAASIEATRRMKEDKPIVAAVLRKWFGIRDPGTVDTIFHLAQGIPDQPAPSVAGIQEAMRVYASPALAQSRAEDFFDATIVNQATRLEAGRSHS